MTKQDYSTQNPAEVFNNPIESGLIKPEAVDELAKKMASCPCLAHLVNMPNDCFNVAAAIDDEHKLRVIEEFGRILYEAKRNNPATFKKFIDDSPFDFAEMSLEAIEVYKSLNSFS